MGLLDIKTGCKRLHSRQNTIGGNDADELYSIVQTTDGGYICGGFSKSNISGDKTENCSGSSDSWIVKLNASGAVQWQNTIAGDSTEYLYSIQPTNDGGYILGGYSDSDISGDKNENSFSGTSDYWVVKLSDATITGIDPSSTVVSENGFTFYPNPVKDYLYFTARNNADLQFEIYNKLGQKVAERADDKKKIYLGNIPTGIYFICATSGDNVFVIKVMVE